MWPAAPEIDRAARAAAAAFPAWRDLPGAKRRKVLHAVADAIEARAEEIALVESSDTGQPIRYMAKAALRGAIIGALAGDAGLGAAIGGAVGAGGGFLYGKAKESEQRAYDQGYRDGSR